MVNPLIYRITCSSLVHLLSLPLDITSTTLLTNEQYNFQIKEIKNILISAIFFSLQNLIYENINFVDNLHIKSATTGLISTPFYLYHEIYKIISRYNFKISEQYIGKIVLIGTIRQISMTIFLYTFSMTNNPYFGFFLTLLANFYGIFIKKYIIILAFPNISLNCNNNNKIIYLLEIFRSSFNDFLTFKLLYNFSYSPFLK
jgi:hypothetical protein